ncbi:ABC transporter ATP-binding protein [Maribacter sp. 2307ULW6-5]|uniref:ABC transporter ATP-binding protein n=1 Tax=Maribacter sp. 2307ULW6-5 TaxID=3386275 RepID=UPI0039BC8C62
MHILCYLARKRNLPVTKGFRKNYVTIEKKEHPTLRVLELAIGYGSKGATSVVSQDISFALPAGQLCAIVGVNGIGKSTLLRTLGNLQPPLSGSICIDGRELHTYGPEELAAKLGMVLTEPLASKNMTVMELIALGRFPYTNWLGRLSKQDREAIDHCVAQTELGDLRHKKCHELSDGQLQRVHIARAMAQNTPLILLDEPTTHLDLHHKVQILKLLKHLAHQQSKTIVFTTHEIDLAIQLCDRILVLDGAKNPFGQPCELISEKAFDRLFPQDSIAFDARSGSFKIKK